MRHLKLLALLAFLAVPAVYSHAQVSFGVQVGPAYGAYGPDYAYDAPPVCQYGFYPYYPYACAPYGYWGPQWFVSGVFIGAGPWYNWYYSHPTYWRGYYGNRFWAHDRGFHDFHDHGFRGGDFHDRGFRGNEGFRGGSGFRGGERGFADNRGFRGGENFRGGNGFRGGDRGFHGGDRGSHGGGDRGFHGGGHDGGRGHGGSGGRGGHDGGGHGGHEGHGR